MSERAFAFLGSGEFGSWHDDVDRWLLERAVGDGAVLVAPAASAPEGEATFDRWGAMGLEHYGRLGVEARILPVRTRADAERAEVVDAVDDASMIFFSGGNPYYLATILAGTPLWDRIVARLDEGLAYAGCSAGVACLASITFDSDAAGLDQVFQAGLGLIPNTLFAPHWDIVDDWVPGARDAITGAAPPGGVLVALDEDTAMIGDGSSWRVQGRQAIHLYRDGAWTTHDAGAAFDLPLLP